MEEKIIDYNEEPVHYCKECLYLGNPKYTETELEGHQLEYCPYCGSTEFEDSHIIEWENKFEEKYKKGKYLKIRNKTWKKIMEM
jgi:hypothetical protein